MESLEEVIRRGDAAYDAGRIEEAAHLYEAAVCIRPSFWYSLYALATCMARLGTDGIAIPLFMQALEQNPEKNHLPTIYNLGLSMRRQGHTKSARQIYGVALGIDPEHEEVMAAMAGTFVNEGEPAEAVGWGDKALARNPDNKRAQHHKAMGLLELGQYEEAFSLYRARYELPEWTKRAYEAEGWPLWDGSPVKTLLIHGEQGIGDEILFMSWLPKLKNCEQVIIECTPRLVKTFSRSFGVPCYATDREVIEAARRGEIPAPDAVLPMGTVPYFAGGLPPHGRFIKLDESRVAHYRHELHKLGNGPYIGISWHGGTVKTHAHIRTTDYQMFEPLTRFGTPISVQYGPREKEAAALGLTHWSEAIADLDELFSLLAALDLVITPNNTTVHMCGALDVPCWTLTPSRPAWRYGMSSDTMPWYRSVRQFRQEGGDWAGVFERVEGELATFVLDAELEAA